MNPPALLFVQLCALNERDTIGDIIRRIPRQIVGIAAVRVLVLDDGSTDGTSDAAREGGADVVIRHAHNRGLAQSFQHALYECLARGATHIVHLDADGQHHPEEIPTLLAPLLSGQADVVIGDRHLAQAGYVSPTKRMLEWVGSWVTRQLSGVPVRDAVCGFRAYTRAAAQPLHITSSFSYTLETLVQMGALRLRVANVGITSQPALRHSRLSRNMLHFVWRQATVLLRAWATQHFSHKFTRTATASRLVKIRSNIRNLTDATSPPHI
jgi:glycosyltransferase involved in cell wall biosynthesis